MKKSFTEVVNEIQNKYKYMHEDTLIKWQHHDDDNLTVEPMHHESHLGLCIGKHANVSSMLRDLMDELHSLNDENLITTPLSGLHFAFLGCSKHIWSDVYDLPEEISDLKNVSHDVICDTDIKLNDLRLLSLPNSLLLVGLPDENSYEMRQELADRILQSKWREYLLDRYNQYAIPPFIWHITLARYKKQHFSEQIKSIYLSYVEKSFGSMQLGSPNLVAVNVDWQRKYAI